MKSFSLLLDKIKFLNRSKHDSQKELIKLMDNSISNIESSNPSYKENILVLCKNNYKWKKHQVQNIFKKFSHLKNHEQLIHDSIEKSLDHKEISQILYQELDFQLRTAPRSEPEETRLTEINEVTKLFKNIFFSLENSEFIHKLHQQIDSSKKMLENARLYDSKNPGSIHYLLGKINDIGETLVDYSKDIQSHDANILAQKAQLAFFDDAIDMKTNDIKLSHKVTIQSLPKDSLEIVESIKNTYQHLIQNKEQWSEEEKFFINNIFDKRLPDTLEIFLSMRPEMHQSFVNPDGKNAQQLLNESLMIILEGLSSIDKQFNQNLLKDLKVHNNYYKSLKM